MEQITATQYTAPRRTLNRKLASLPPIATGLPESPMMSMNEKFPQSVDLRSPSSSTSSSGACQKMLPCIMITPSSPTHEYDYEIHYFQLPERRSSKCRGFLSSVRQAFCPSSSTSPISLPETPLVSQYGYTSNSSSADRSWSASRRFRMILALAAVLFFALHLIAIPKLHNGVYEVFSTDHHGAGTHMVDDAVASWETVSDWQPAPPANAHSEHSKPVDGVAEPNNAASSLD